MGRSLSITLTAPVETQLSLPNLCLKTKVERQQRVEQRHSRIDQPQLVTISDSRRRRPVQPGYAPASGESPWAIPAALRLARLGAAEPTAPDRPSHEKVRTMTPEQEEKETYQPEASVHLGCRPTFTRHGAN